MLIVHRLKKAILAVFPVLLLICGSATESKADTVSLCNPDSPGQCSAIVAISGNTLTITLINTSPFANGGFITAAAFNLAPGTLVNTFNTTNSNFVLFNPGHWTGDVSPDGTRTHMISATGNDYNAEFNPNGGTPPGTQVTFTLTLASLNGNTEENIIHSILVHQRGFQDGGSDKDALIPEPASMLLLGTGLIGMFAGLRKRYRKK